MTTDDRKQDLIEQAKRAVSDYDIAKAKRISPNPDRLAVLLAEMVAVFESAQKPSDDERIDAWHYVADHEAFKGCYDEEQPLIDSVLNRITQLHELESTVNELAPAPQPQCEPTDAAEAGARALEDAAEAINRDFQSLPSWNESYRNGERTQDWMSGGTRMTIDTIDWLRARASAMRAAAEEGKKRHE